MLPCLPLLSTYIPQQRSKCISSLGKWSYNNHNWSLLFLCVSSSEAVPIHADGVSASHRRGAKLILRLWLMTHEGPVIARHSPWVQSPEICSYLPGRDEFFGINLHSCHFRSHLLFAEERRLTNCAMSSTRWVYFRPRYKPFPPPQKKSKTTFGKWAPKHNTVAEIWWLDEYCQIFIRLSKRCWKQRKNIALDGRETCFVLSGTKFTWSHHKCQQNKVH